MPVYNTLLGFDFGMKRIGVAIGQTITQTARPLTTLAAHNGIPSEEEIKHLIERWRPNALVIGIPLNMDGSEQNTTAAARALKDWLAAHCELPVYEVDERLSTKSAREHVFNDGGFRSLQNAEIDSVAAQIILQDWLTQDHTS